MMNIDTILKNRHYVLMTQISPDIRTLEQARAWFEACGITVSDWAKEKGFPSHVVYAVLAGRTRGRRGIAHQVAVALGIKAFPPMAGVELDSVVQEVKKHAQISSEENSMPP